MVTTRVQLENHLAEFCIGKWGRDFSQPVRFPDNTDVYHTVYFLTQKRPSNIFRDVGNLEIILPEKHADGEEIRKRPDIYNYISERGCFILNKKIKLIFWSELHELIDSEKHFFGAEIGETIYTFMSKYRITSITEDALYKNYQRWRNTIRQRQRRGYKKRK